MNARAPITTPTLFCVSGELREAPSVRIRPVMEGGHPMPVLTLVLHKVGPYAKTVVCEQVFPEAAIAAAYARAKQLKPGMPLEVQAPLEMMEVHLHAVAHIHQLDKSKTNQPQEASHV